MTRLRCAGTGARRPSLWRCPIPNATAGTLCFRRPFFGRPIFREVPPLYREANPGFQVCSSPGPSPLGFKFFHPHPHWDSKFSSPSPLGFKISVTVSCQKHQFWPSSRPWSMADQTRSRTSAPGMMPPYRRPGESLYGPVFTNTVHSRYPCFRLRQSLQTPTLKPDFMTDVEPGTGTETRV